MRELLPGSSAVVPLCLALSSSAPGAELNIFSSRLQPHCAQLLETQRIIDRSALSGRL